MSVDSAALALSGPVLAARYALAEVLGRPLDVWQRNADGEWDLAASSGDEDTEWSAPPADDNSFVELLNATFELCRAHTTDRGIRDAWLAAPITDSSGNTLAVATTTVESASASYARRLADLTLQNLSQQGEIDWLREENSVFSQQVTDDFEELTFLRTMATSMVVDDTTLDINKIVAQSLPGLREMIGAESLFFVTPADGDGLHVARHSSSRPTSRRILLEAALTRIARDHRRLASAGPCVRNDVAQCDREASEAGIHQFLMTPVLAGTQHFGWFVAVNRALVGRAWPPSPLLQLGHDEFGTWEASLLSTAATLLASHASNLDLIREKEQLLVNTVRSLVSAIDAKDAYTRGHSERVARFSRRIAESMGFDPTEAGRLYLAGLLHDVGKIGVSDAVLRKPGTLTDEEYAEIKLHPDEGWSILRDLEQLRYVLPGVLHHHEQVNGSGYPDGLAGDEIPLDARIMAVADAYDAMTSDRAYRKGMPHDTAMRIIREGAGRQWDAEVVAAFESVVDDIIAIRYGYRPTERSLRTQPALTPNCRS